MYDISVANGDASISFITITNSFDDVLPSNDIFEAGMPVTAAIPVLVTTILYIPETAKEVGGVNEPEILLLKSAAVPLLLNALHI